MTGGDYLGLFDPETWCVEPVNQVTPEYQVELVLGVTLLEVAVSLVAGQVGQPSPPLLALHHLYETLRVVVRLNLRGKLIKYLSQCENCKPSGNIYKVPAQFLQDHSPHLGQSQASLQTF